MGMDILIRIWTSYYPTLQHALLAVYVLYYFFDILIYTLVGIFKILNA